MRAMCGPHLSLAEEVPVSIRRLTRGQVAQAFPLLREAGRCESFQAWIDYAAQFIDGNQERSWPSGIMIAEQANRCIVGLYSYVVRPCLRLGRVLTVGELTVMTPFGRDVVAERLLASVAELARIQGVTGSEIGVASASGWWATLLRSRGFALDDRRQLIWRRASQREPAAVNSITSAAAALDPSPR
jgi:hypothetical protein